MHISHLLSSKKNHKLLILPSAVQDSVAQYDQ